MTDTPPTYTQQARTVLDMIDTLTEQRNTTRDVQLYETLDNTIDTAHTLVRELMRASQITSTPDAHPQPDTTNNKGGLGRGLGKLIPTENT